MEDNTNERGNRGGFGKGFNRGQRSKEGFQPREKKDPEDVVYGIRAVIEAIRNDSAINRILIQKGMDKQLFEELKETLRGKEYQLQFVPIEKINKITSGNHQGVVAYVSPVAYHNMEELADRWIAEGKEPCILVLDRITDVRNFGGIARTAACMGVDAILIPEKGSALVTADAIKTSAGALHTIPVCKSPLLKDSLFYLQQSGFQIVSCTEKSKIRVENYSFFGPTAIVMGSEENGISQDILKLSDARLTLPMAGEISSLNVGVAAGMILYERLRQIRNS